MAVSLAQISNVSNPLTKANSSYINALYQYGMGRNATAAEIAKFSANSVKDASNLILGKRSPFLSWKPPATPKAPVSTNPVAPAPSTPALPPDVQTIIDQYANQIAKQPPAPKPFEQTGLYNEADVNAKAAAEYNPYFTTQLNDLLSGIGTQRTRSQEDLQKALAQIGQERQYAQTDASKNLGQQLNQLSGSYADRGLLKSGGFEANKQYATTENQNMLQRAMQGYDQQQTGYTQQNARTLEDLTKQQTQGSQNIEQSRLQALASYKNTAYSNAYQKYLASLGQY